MCVLKFALLKLLNIPYLNELIVFELKIAKRICKIVTLYRRIDNQVNQTTDNKFQTFTGKLLLKLKKIFQKTLC